MTNHDIQRATAALELGKRVATWIEVRVLLALSTLAAPLALYHAVLTAATYLDGGW